VLYGVQGLCRIAEISERDFTGKRTEYYVLKPVYDEKATIFIPVQNEALIQKMRRILSSDEIYDLIRNMPAEETIWIENENARRERYKQILSGGDRAELIQLIKTLYQRQQSQKAKGKKLHVTDDRFMREAEKMLYEEFAHVLNISPEQVLPFIIDHIAYETTH
jgi:CarD family transcriptional regulator